VQAASIPEAPSTKATTMQPLIFPTSGPDYQPVVTLNGWTLPWRATEFVYEVMSRRPISTNMLARTGSRKRSEMRAATWATD
jgi:hypothetical protein